MKKTLNRRDFLLAGATAGLAAASPRTLFGQAPAVIAKGFKPVVVASANGNEFKSGGDVTGVQKAFTMMTQGADVLDALVLRP
jgi:hypothetical protein